MAEDDSTDETEFDPEDLPERKQQVVRAILDPDSPSDADGIGDLLGITASAVYNHVQGLNEAGLDVDYDHSAKEYYVPDEDQARRARRVSTKHKGQVTREANEFATEQEAAVLRRLEGKQDLDATPAFRPGGEDLVYATGDLHMGDVVEVEDGREVYNPALAADLFDYSTRRVLAVAERFAPEDGYDTLHVPYLGDMLTNENIYDGQQFNIRLKLADQMTEAVGCMVRQIRAFAESELFDTVQVIPVPGNHGMTRASGVSKQANMDLIAYRWLHDRLVDGGYGDRVKFLEPHSTHYRNFKVRGGKWNGHARHGHNAQEHIDATARSEADWRGWVLKHEFDLAVLGHHHKRREADVTNEFPVVGTPSPKPGDDFAEKIGKPDTSATRKLGTLFGVSDEEPKTWTRTITDSEFSW